MDKNFIVQQSDLDIIRQAPKNYYIKLENLNSNFKVLDYLESELINDNYSFDANSDVRRTYTCELFIKNSSFFIGEDKKFWLDRLIRPYIGILNIRTNTVQWYLMGTYNIKNLSYNGSEKIMTLELNDLMTSIDGTLNGQIEGLETKILAGENVRNVILALIKESGLINKYILNNLDTLVIPYDLQYSTSTTYYEIIKDIINLYSGFEVYFDVNGTFIIDKIPTCKDDDIILDNKFFQQLITNELSHDFSLTDVYNHIQVWGASIESDRMAETCLLQSNVYNATFKELLELINFERYAINILETNPVHSKIKINNNIPIPITKDNGEILPSNTLPLGINVFMYRKKDNNFYWLGQYQVFGEAKNENPNSPFSIKKIGNKLNSLHGGDCEKIHSNDLADQRARYELYLSTQLKDTISLEIIQIPWLFLNSKIEYKPSTGDFGEYIVKKIQGSTTTGIITIDLMKFYPEYPEII